MITSEMINLSRLNEGNRVRLAGKLKKAGKGKNLTVAYIGGSITQRFSAEPNECYARLTTDWFEKTFPDITVTYVNAGIGATGSYIGVHRVENDILASQPDIVFVDFSVNDAADHTERNINSYDSLLRKIWRSKSRPAIITIAMTMEDGISFQAQHSEIIKAYDFPMISYGNAVLHAIKKGDFPWSAVSDDDIHPNKTGHGILAELVIAYLSDVLAKRAAMKGRESDIRSAYTKDKYAKATLIRPGDKIRSEGSFVPDKDCVFGNFKGVWQDIMTGDERNHQNSLVIEVKCKNIGIFYSKLVKGGGRCEVVVDGTSVALMDCDFTDGWGDYVDAMEIYAGDTVKKHVVEILPVGVASGEECRCLISAIAVS